MQSKAMHTTVMNPILSEAVFERLKRGGGGAIANKEEESTAMDTAIRLVYLGRMQNNG